MQNLRERLDHDLAGLSAAYRNLVPTERENVLQAALTEVLEARYHELLEAAKKHLAKLATPPGKDDSWSW